MRRGLPRAYPGMRIGLLGGSFDPAHTGHSHVAATALKRMGLDQVWWLVSPQNPLKPQSGPFLSRLASAKAAAPSRRHLATDLETRLGVRYTADTLRALKRRYPGVSFVWLMGADGMTSFRRWKRWRTIFASTPIAVVARPGVAPRGRRDVPFQAFSSARAPVDRILPGRSPPAWGYLPARFNPESSTALRALEKR